MTHRIHDQIRKTLETTEGLTQKGLAERMGINPAAVNRMLYGRRNIMAEEIPIIENYLGVRLSLSTSAVSTNTKYRQEQDAPSDTLAVPWLSSPENKGKVPVYGIAAGESRKELIFSADNIIDWVLRHPEQSGIGNAFAIYVSSNTMEPRYFQGELIYLHPGRPPEMNRDCIIEMKNGAVYVRHFMRWNKDKIRIAQFNPPEEKDILRDEIKAVYAVVGRG